MYPNPASLRALILTVTIVFACIIPSYAVPSPTAKLLLKSPERYSIDPLRLTVEGALSGGLVVINATLVDDEDRTWSSRAVFYADAQGHVDVSRAFSTAGTYTGIDPDGLVWSMLPISLGNDVLRADRRNWSAPEKLAHSLREDRL